LEALGINVPNLLTQLGAKTETNGVPAASDGRDGEKVE
jgi:hypothetical protein